MSCRRPLAVVPWFAISVATSGCVVDDAWPGADEPVEAPARDPIGSVTGAVRDLRGFAVSGAHVTTSPGGVEATVRADGTFEIPRLAAGVYTVVGVAPGAQATSSAPFVVEAGRNTGIDLVLLQAADVDGLLRVRVVGPTGAPVAGAEIALDGGVIATTDADGRATIAGRGGATVDLVATDPTGRLWSRTATDVAIPALGGTDVAFELGGRPAADSTYIGPILCNVCHPDKAAAVADTAHGRALTAVTGAPAAAFDTGLTVKLGAASAALLRVSGAPTVRLTGADGKVDVWTVSGFIGGADRGAVPWAERSGVAYALPVAWTPTDGWIAASSATWFGSDGKLAYAGAPPSSASAEANCFGCHATGYELAPDGAGGVTMTAPTGSGRWLAGSVSCEACHGPGSDHAAGPLAEKSIRITNPSQLDPDAANDVCGQCHAALVGAEGTPYPWHATLGRYRAGDRLSDHADSAYEPWPNGAANQPNAAADELARSGHSTGAWSSRCSDCHDPHGTPASADLRLEHTDNKLCATCHLGYTFGGVKANLVAHTGHVDAPTSLTRSGRCTGCHMPETASRFGFDPFYAAGDLGSHRFLAIPPSDSLAFFDAAGADTLAPGTFVPNACQACHAWNEILFEEGFPGPAGDMTLRATHEGLQEGYEEKYP